MLAYFKLAVLGLIVLTAVGAIDGKTMTQELLEAEMDALATFSNIYEESVKPQEKCLQSGLCNKSEECCTRVCIVPLIWPPVPGQCIPCSKTGSHCTPENPLLCCSGKCIPHPKGARIFVCA